MPRRAPDHRLPLRRWPRPAHPGLALGLVLVIGIQPALGETLTWLAGTLAAAEVKRQFIEDVVCALRASEREWAELERALMRSRADRLLRAAREMDYEDKRLDRLEEVLDQTLARTGMFAPRTGRRVGLEVDAIAPLDGQFDSLRASITVDRTLLPRGPLSRRQAARLAEVLYHELRHAEQYLQVARWLVATGQTRLLPTIGVPAHVAYSAFLGPRLALGSPLAQAAERWFARWTPPHRGRHDDHQMAADRLRRAKDERAALLGAGAGQAVLVQAERRVRAQEEAYQATLPGYRGLPTEEDSRHVAEGCAQATERAWKSALCPGNASSRDG